MRNIFAFRLVSLGFLMAICASLTFGQTKTSFIAIPVERQTINGTEVLKPVTEAALVNNSDVIKYNELFQVKTVNITDRDGIFRRVFDRNSPVALTSGCYVTTPPLQHTIVGFDGSQDNHTRIANNTIVFGPTFLENKNTNLQINLKLASIQLSNDSRLSPAAEVFDNLKGYFKQLDPFASIANRIFGFIQTRLDRHITVQNVSIPTKALVHDGYWILLAQDSGNERTFYRNFTSGQNYLTLGGAVLRQQNGSLIDDRGSRPFFIIAKIERVGFSPTSFRSDIQGFVSNATTFSEEIKTKVKIAIEPSELIEIKEKYYTRLMIQNLDLALRNPQFIDEVMDNDAIKRSKDDARKNLALPYMEQFLDGYLDLQLSSASANQIFLNLVNNYIDYDGDKFPQNTINNGPTLAKALKRRVEKKDVEVNYSGAAARVVKFKLYSVVASGNRRLARLGNPMEEEDIPSYISDALNIIKEQEIFMERETKDIIAFLRRHFSLVAKVGSLEEIVTELNKFQEQLSQVTLADDGKIKLLSLSEAKLRDARRLVASLPRNERKSAQDRQEVRNALEIPAKVLADGMITSPERAMITNWLIACTGRRDLQDGQWRDWLSGIQDQSLYYDASQTPSFFVNTPLRIAFDEVISKHTYLILHPTDKLNIEYSASTLFARLFVRYRNEPDTDRAIEKNAIDEWLRVNTQGLTIPLPPIPKNGATDPITGWMDGTQFDGNKWVYNPSLAELINEYTAFLTSLQDDRITTDSFDKAAQWFVANGSQLTLSKKLTFTQKLKDLIPSQQLSQIPNTMDLTTETGWAVFLKNFKNTGIQKLQSGEVKISIVPVAMQKPIEGN